MGLFRSMGEVHASPGRLVLPAKRGGYLIDTYGRNLYWSATFTKRSPPGGPFASFLSPGIKVIMVNYDTLNGMSFECSERCSKSDEILECSMLRDEPTFCWFGTV